jgi:aryl-alcohol dehydrogenase-like predicted oxidoreductase
MSMTVTRRKVVQGGAAVAAAAAVPWRLGGAQADDLIRRTIPSSGESIVALGVGTNRYGVGDSTEARAPLRESLAAFHALGGQLIDTSEEYGSSEVVLGELIDELGLADELFLATKVRRFGRAEGSRIIERSFERLRKNTLDLIQVHDLIDFETQIETLRELKADGRIRYTGMTTAGDEHPVEFERLMRTDTVDFVQLSYSIDDRRAADRWLPLAADRGMAVLVNRALGRGNLFRTIGSRALPEWAAEFDCASWSQFLLKYVISHPAVTCAIPGMRQARHVEDNMAAVRGRLPDAAMRRRMEQHFDSIV